MGDNERLLVMEPVYDRKESRLYQASNPRPLDQQVVAYSTEIQGLGGRFGNHRLFYNNSYDKKYQFLIPAHLTVIGNTLLKIFADI